jgi:hypothetical protein
MEKGVTAVIFTSAFLTIQWGRRGQAMVLALARSSHNAQTLPTISKTGGIQRVSRSAGLVKPDAIMSSASVRTERIASRPRKPTRAIREQDDVW